VQHCTPEQLALAALQEPLPAEDSAHLETCEQCRAEVASLQRAVDLLAVPEFATTGAPVAPPPQVWAAIAAQTGVSASPAPPAAESVVVPFRRRRPRTLLLTAAAAVVGAVIGAGAVAVLAGGSDDDGTSIAAAELDPLENHDASGTARVVEQPDGTQVLEIKLEAPAPTDGYYEVWLLKPDVSGLVPVGVTQAGTSVLEIPPGLDLSQYPVVDVSIEPLDGNPEHSGVSIARGVLDT
jgi:anti-sigma-K factor RskA